MDSFRKSAVIALASQNAFLKNFILVLHVHSVAIQTQHFKLYFHSICDISFHEGFNHPIADVFFHLNLSSQLTDNDSA